MAGYVEPGPLRPPFLDIPADVVEAQKKRVERWHQLCAKFAPAYQQPEKKRIIDKLNPWATPAKAKVSDSQ